MRRKTPSDVTGSLANHGSLSKAMPFGVRNRPGVVGASRSPPFRAQQEQLGAAGKCQELGEMLSSLGKCCPASKIREKMTSQLDFGALVQFFSCSYAHEGPEKPGVVSWGRILRGCNFC